MIWHTTPSDLGTPTSRSGEALGKTTCPRNHGTILTYDMPTRRRGREVLRSPEIEAATFASLKMVNCGGMAARNIL
jgi:hypothetical protein